MKIYVYKGEGVAPFSLRQALSSLKKAFPEASAAPIDAGALAEGAWANDATLLAVPGGRDLFYHHALKGAANRHIRNFVEGGGAYLGLCAGAYYASRKVVFEKGRSLEVIGERELVFFPGETHGSLFEKSFTYESEESTESVAIDLGKGPLGQSPLGQSPLGQSPLDCYYNGGCAFQSADDYPNTKVLARYRDLPGRPAAIVGCTVGKGRALLSGVHLEHSYPALKRRPIASTLLHRFQASEERRAALFNSLVRELVR